jgi:FKBP-type peptidyl-prolyl cis-trans isomerase
MTRLIFPAFKRSKGFALVLAASLFLLIFASCRGEKPAPGALDRDTSYAFGMLLAATQPDFSEFSYDYTAFMEGFRDFNEARETRLTQEAAQEKIIAAFIARQNQAVPQMSEEELEEFWLLGQQNLAEGEAYLAENARRSGVITTPSGLQYEVLTQGTGARPTASDIVQVHYEGTFIDGTIFDSSFVRGAPFEFPLGGNFIPGWREGIQLMPVGSTYRFVIPSDLAYGPGAPGGFPPNATLIFQVELLDIIR